MSATTKIQWTDKSWNPVRGCALVSEGCRSCYAMKTAHRFSGKWRPYEGLTRLGNHGPVWTGRAREVPELLVDPLRWRKSQRIFVNSMSDLFHEDVSFGFIAAVFGIMAATPRHTYQVLTKRPKRALEWFAWAGCLTLDDIRSAASQRVARQIDRGTTWPLRNVWLGVSVEDQATADERIPQLLKIPAAVRFLSCEPLLGPLNLLHGMSCDPLLRKHAHGSGEKCNPECRKEHIGWVIIGGESGHNARPMDLDWARKIIAECKMTDVPVFVKQLGLRPVEHGVPLRGELRAHPTRLRDQKGGNVDEWPDDLRIRQWPALAS